LKIAYFDPFAGAAGDMVVGALLDAGASFDAVRQAVSSTGLAGVELGAEKVQRGGLAATHFSVKAPAEDAHRHLPDILAMIAKSSLSERGRERAVAVFEKLSEAEGRVHGIAPREVHFHEVGAEDAIADVIGSVAALESLGVEEVLSGPPALGHQGFVTCEHGKLPIPVPAVIELCKGQQLLPGLQGVEMTTPTGAAILTALAGKFTAMPEMELSASGCGAGTRDEERMPNFLRVLVGESSPPCEGAEDPVVEISTAIDDLSGEVLGYLFERLPGAGALEVSLLPATLKKNRSGQRLTVLAPAGKLDAVAAAIFRETGTLGLRYTPVSRIKLERHFETVATRWGAVRVKCGYLGGELVTVHPEFEDCRQLAAEQRVPLKDVQAEAVRLFADHASS
jgi:pyridinium-3,5-bisthiocarboxylic acid mononucleotide nickel chelatase